MGPARTSCGSRVDPGAGREDDGRAQDEGFWSPGCGWRVFFSPLIHSLSLGPRLLLGRHIEVTDIHGRLTPVVMLFVLCPLWWLAVQYLGTEAPRVFSLSGLYGAALRTLVLLGALLTVSTWLDERRTVLPFFTVALSGWFFVDVLYGFAWLYAVTSGAEKASGLNLLWWGANVLSALLLYRAARTVAAWVPGKALLSGIAVVVVVSTAGHYLPSFSFWYQDYSTDDSAEQRAKLDVEALYYRQPALMEAALASVEAEVPGQLDVFFVGFSPYAEQDVFSREIDFVAETVGVAFNAAPRSVLLVNHPDRVASTPLANEPNLRRALQHMGERMDRANDLVLVYLTSHGSRDARLAADFWPVQSNPLRARGLRKALDDSGIRWRLIIVSACFSGTFIDALRDEHTMVLTAAREDRASFGCSNDRTLTYFGEHFIRDGISAGKNLTEAFDTAVESLTQREAGEGHEPSLPQRFIGEMFRTKLAELEALQARQPE